MSNVLVTGGGGFIGSHIVDKLLSMDYDVTVVDYQKNIPLNLKHHINNKKFKYIVCDVTNKKLLEEIISKDDYETIYHLAAVVGVKNYTENPLNTINVNVIGTKNIIDIALKNDIKILFTSTSEIFGKNPNIPWDEDSDRILGSTRIHRWAYSTSKALCEHMLFAVYNKYKLPIVIVRYFNIYGPRQKPIFVIPSMIKRVLNGQNPIVFSDGEQTRCFTYIEDAVEGTILAATKKVAEGEAFNIGSKFEMKIKDIAKLIIKLCGMDGKLYLEFKENHEVYSSYEDIKRRVPKVEKAKNLLGWIAKTTPEDGIKKTIEWYKKHPEYLS